mgnify:CR=1 FL=1
MTNSITDAKITLDASKVRMLIQLEDMLGLFSRDHFPQDELFEFQEVLLVAMTEAVNSGKVKINLAKQLPHLFNANN